MLKKFGISAALIALALVVLPTGAHAATNLELEAQIKGLMETIVKLQAQVAAMHGQQQQIGVLLKAGLKQGMTDEDVKKIQEILATDPEVYPQGLVTGYFGPLTKEALKRFQHKFALTVSGDVDTDTHEYLEKLLEERFNGHIPPGLLRAPGIAKKIELRMLQGCDSGKIPAGGLLCKNLKVKHGENVSDDDSDDGGDEDSDDANSANDSEDVDEIIAVVHEDDDETEVTVTYDNGDEEEFTYETTNHNDIIEEIADELDMDKDDVKSLITFEDGDQEIESIKVEFDGNDTDVTVKRVGGTENFTLDNVTKHNDVIEGIANELDIDEDDVRDMIEWQDGELTIEVVTEDGDADVDVTYENGDHASFVLNTDDEDEIVDAVADRTDLTTDEIEEVIEFDHN